MRTERGHEIQGVEALGQNLVENQQRSAVVSGKEAVDKAEAVLVVQDIQIVKHVRIFHLRTAEGDGLVEDCQRVAHRPVGLVGYHVQRLVVDDDTLLLRDGAQVADNVRHAYAIEVVCLAAAQDGGENLMLLGGRQDEDGVCGRFLQSLQEGVEGRRRKHVDLVYDIDRILPGLRRYLHLVHEILDVVDSVVGSGVKLVDAIRTPFSERYAGLAFAAGRQVRSGIRAVDGLREYSRRARLPDPSRSAEQIGVGQLSAKYRVFERLCYIVLTYKRFKSLRTIFAG